MCKQNNALELLKLDIKSEQWRHVRIVLLYLLDKLSSGVQITESFFGKDIIMNGITLMNWRSKDLKPK
jgi:hypothetical protein